MNDPGSRSLCHLRLGRTFSFQLLSTFVVGTQCLPFCLLQAPCSATIPRSRVPNQSCQRLRLRPLIITRLFRGSSESALRTDSKVFSGTAVSGRALNGDSVPS